jgi:hypothetical protein
MYWKEAKVLQIEPNTTYRKYKESVNMSLLDHTTSQPSVDISAIWPPSSQQKSRDYSAVVGKFLFLLLVPHGEFYFPVKTSILIFL